jgi:type IX secretion system PorP/SprF family membrane protein
MGIKTFTALKSYFCYFVSALRLFTIIECYFLILTCEIKTYGQDPAYSSFHSNRLLFNPALVGSQGAQSYTMKAKTQWLNDGGHGYKTISFTAEETVPCSIMDFGVKALVNEEGIAGYRTVELGLLSAMYIPFSWNQWSDHNFRLGLDAAWGWNTVDYSKFVFSDQLDSKYGIVRPSSFVVPNDGISRNFFNPGVGCVIRSLWNKTNRHAFMTNIGLSMYRFYTFSSGQINQSVSVLGLDSPNPNRYAAFAEIEFIVKYIGRRSLTLRPQIVYQKQGDISYIEMGSRFGLARDLGLGLYYHLVPRFNNSPTKWITATFDVLKSNYKGRAVAFNFSYSLNVGGLKNFSGPQFELGIAYHLAKSTICKISGMEDAVNYSYEYKCPYYSFPPGKRKYYENLWSKLDE